LAEAKKYAAESGCTLTAVLEDALRESLARRRERGARKPVRLKTVKGDGVRPGVDLDDSLLACHKYEPESCASWDVIFRQSPKTTFGRGGRSVRRYIPL